MLIWPAMSFRPIILLFNRSGRVSEFSVVFMHIKSESQHEKIKKCQRPVQH